MRARNLPAAPAAAGFTLVELMTVVVIGTILVALAIPAYTSQVQKSRRTDARTAVLDLAGREERFFSTNTAYSADPTQLGYAPLGSGAVFPQLVGSNYYQITVVTPNPAWTGNGPSFLVTATPAPGSSQLNDTQCTSFMVDQTGLQTATGSLGNSCWQN
jgi:type IV pilus assembly protein PilE